MAMLSRVIGYISRIEWRRRGTGYLLFDAGVVAVLLVLVGIAFMNIVGERIVAQGMNELAAGSNSVLADREGRVVKRLVAPDLGYRAEASVDEMPSLLLDAFIATEDRRFYEHGAIDWIGIARSVRSNLSEGGLYEGGSTITQQLARTVYLSNRKTFSRKLTEIAIAQALEKRMSKEQILTLYLNHIYFGRQQVGVKAAAIRYFGIQDLKQLKLWQIATLAAIPKAPSRYNPVDDYDKSKERRKVVLKLMHEQGLITKEQMLEAQAVDYSPPKPAKAMSGYEAYTDYAIGEAMEKTGLSRYELLTGGYTIVTGLHTKRQQLAEKVFADERNFPQAAKTAGGSTAARSVQGSAAIIDHRSGEVVALIGGRGYRAGEFNRAVRMQRQPGSALKPLIVYGPALESGQYDAQSLLQDKMVHYGNYRPENGGGVYRGEVKLSDAVRQSMNAPAVWLLNQLGVTGGIRFAERLGLEFSREDANLAVALGGMHRGVSPLQMAQAYSAFAGGGVLHEAHAVRLIKDKFGHIVYSYNAPGQTVMSAGTASAMTTLLREVVASGTGKQAALPNRWVAGKTGTTQLGMKGVTQKANRDLWFAGYTAELTAAVWVGYDLTDQDHYMTATSAVAARLFARVMQ